MDKDPTFDEWYGLYKELWDLFGKSHGDEGHFRTQWDRMNKKQRRWDHQNIETHVCIARVAFTAAGERRS